MIDRTQLLSDLQTLVRQLENDLQERIDSPEVPEVGEKLKAEFQKAKKAERTAQNFNQWVSDYKTQVAVAWVLSATFARFLEDNGLVSPPRLSGPGDNLQRARDEHELYFREHPTETDREYLLWMFRQLARLPGAQEILGEGNLIWDLPNWLSGDAAGDILKQFQAIDPNTGALVHDFTDPEWDTRFLGDLYQDLSEAARKKYALLQTPIFVEEFILDRTLEPAVEEFGLSDFRMIDPACGSGHFLLGSFHRLLDRWQRKEPGTNVEELARRALESVHGVDVNPFAVAIARFRLLLAAMKATNQKELKDARDFPLNLACGDSLIHGDWHQIAIEGVDPEAHTYSIEDMRVLMGILIPGHYHAVVANPPYIVPKDKALKVAYKERYESCYMKYSLAVPFMERIFQLAVLGGFTGQITANSFMKREFGKKLIEEFFPKVDLTHVIDTSGAYIPGHGTPTVILFGRNRESVASTIRTVMGIRGEPSTPEEPTQGVVWSAILDQVDVEGSESEFISVIDSKREIFSVHPWSIGGGGAAELKVFLDKSGVDCLDNQADSIGITSFPMEDGIFLLPYKAARRARIPDRSIRIMVVGDAIRDWILFECDACAFPYSEDFQPIKEELSEPVIQYLWHARSVLSNSLMFAGKTKVETGLKWYEFGRLTAEKLRTPLSLAFGEVATHNHFYLDRGGKIFKNTVQVIKLKTDSEDSHVGILGLLNSSTSCFWLKQICHNKGSTVDQRGARQRTNPFEDFFQYNGTKLKGFPLPSGKPHKLSADLDDLSRELYRESPNIKLESSKEDWFSLLEKMIFLQEELDWQCYTLYNLLDDELVYTKDPFPIQLGQRAFEIIMARKMAAGELETTWFERHRSTPITELPDHWPDDYKQLVERRIQLIETDKNIRLIEQPEYKRRWNTEPWESQLERALQTWLLNRLESYFDLDGRMNDAGEITAQITDPALISTVKLADIARKDPDFLQVGELYTKDPAFDVLSLVNTLVDDESVPLLPILRYKPSGLRKRQDWEHTWQLQRQEDAIDARTQLPKDHPDHLDATAAKNLKAKEVGDIPVPPKYKTSDFQKTHYWKLRGKLDVPKERWVSFPHCEGPDGQPVIAWAGYDHLQLALAISTYFVYIKEEVGGSDDPRLVPLLAGLIELLPWLKQWHNELDPAYGLKMGDYIAGFVEDEARQLNLTIEEIQSWEPPAKKGRKRR